MLSVDSLADHGTSNGVVEGSNAELGHLLDQEALRKVLSWPAYTKFARLLCRFVNAQHELTRRQQQAMKARQSSASGDCPSKGGTTDSFSTQQPKRMTMKERIAARQAAKLKDEHNLRENDCPAATSSVAGAERGKYESSTATRSAGADQAESVPMFAAEAKQRLPRGFGQVALQKWFDELDTNRDGIVTSRDLCNWCATANCQNLVDETDLESLFHPSLPNFASPTYEAALYTSPGDLTSPVAKVQQEALNST